MTTPEQEMRERELARRAETEAALRDNKPAEPRSWDRAASAEPGAESDSVGESIGDPTGASAGGDPTGLSGAATGAKGAQVGHAGGASAWSDSGGGATGAAQISGGSSGVNPQTHITGSGPGVLNAYGATSQTGPAGAAHGGRATPPEAEPGAIQNVTDGRDPSKDDKKDERD